MSQKDKDFIEAMKSQYQSTTSNRNTSSDLDNLINPEEFNEPNGEFKEIEFEVKTDDTWRKSVVIFFIIFLVAITISIVAKFKIGKFNLFIVFFLNKT